MLSIKNAITITGQPANLAVPCEKNMTIQAEGLMVFPGLIDPHVHFRVPGLARKEDWETASAAALSGGYTTVFDMPNTVPPTITAAYLKQKKQLIDTALKKAKLPLRYHLYFGADKHHVSEIHRVKNEVIGLKVFMGESTGQLLVDDDESLHAVFAIAATQNLLVAVHAEDAAHLRKRAAVCHGKHYHDHSTIRDVKAATLAVQKAIDLAKIYGVRLYILHVTSRDEIVLIKKAKQAGLPVYAEVTPHHLFLDDRDYKNLQGRALVNPPLRNESHRLALWEAIKEGVIDTIGSDHAPHLLSEKAEPYGRCPCGMPGIETTLPLLITAYHEGLITLDKILSLTCHRVRDIFHLPHNDDVVLVDVETAKPVIGKALHTKCHWSPFEGRILKGWPKHVVVQGQYVKL